MAVFLRILLPIVIFSIYFSSEPLSAQENEISMVEVRVRAERAAKESLAAIEAQYTPLVTFTNSFQEGFFRALVDLKWDFSSRPEHLNIYQQSYRNGESQGRVDGLLAGQSQATRIGKDRGAKLARERFESAIDKGVVPTDQVVVPPSGFSGMRAHLPEPWSVGRRLLRKRSELYSEIQKRVPFEDWQYGWDLNHLFRDLPENQKLKFNWEGSWVFRKWLALDLSVKSGVTDIEWYRNLKDQFSNGETAQREFEKVYVSTYELVFDAALIGILKNKDMAGDDFGYRFSYEVFSSYAEELGYFDSYYDTYLKSSIEGYENVFSREFLKGFSQTYNNYANNPVEDALRVSIEDQNGQRNYAPGLKISISVRELRNYGGRLFSEPIRVSGASLANDFVSTEEVQLESLSSLASAQQFIDVGPLKEDLTLDKTYLLTVYLGNQQQKVEFQVSFEGIVKQLLKYDLETLEQELLIDRLVKELSSEWDELSTGLFTGNPYRGGNQVTYLETLLELFEKADPEFQLRLQERIADIRSSIGKRPGNWLYFLQRRRWDSANKLMKRLEK